MTTLDPLKASKIRYLALSNNMLDLIILPTEKCNFRCKYCYEDFKIGKMPSSIVNGIISLINHRAPSINLLTLNFFGGEPLLAHDVVMKICRAAMECSRRYPNMTFKGMATTNGSLLTDSRLKEYYDVGLRRYQISFDGEPDVHDRWRVRANGRGSFDEIWSNVLNIRNSNLDVEVLLRLHVLPETVSSVANLIDRINSQIGDDPRFNIFLKEIVHLGGKNDTNVNIFDTGSSDYRHSMEFLKNKINFDSLRGKVSEQQAIFDEMCYASRANSLVIRARGQIAKCTALFDDERNNIGMILQDGRIKIDTKKLAPWLRGLKTLDASDLHCPLAGLTKYLSNIGPSENDIQKAG